MKLSQIINCTLISASIGIILGIISVIFDLDLHIWTIILPLAIWFGSAGMIIAKSVKSKQNSEQSKK